MKEQKNKTHLICLTGLTGSGKTTIKNIFASYGGVMTFYTKELHKIVFGQQIGKVNKMDVSMFLPQKNDFIKRIMAYISERKKDAKVVVLDSIRSTDELKYLKSLSDYASVSLICVMCNEEKRVERLKKRDHCDEKNIQIRDLRDSGEDGTHMFNMKELFKEADFIIDTSNSFGDVRKQVYKILLKTIGMSQKLSILKTLLINKQKGEREWN